jgi:hypothetical protein
MAGATTQGDTRDMWSVLEKLKKKPEEKDGQK